MKKAFLLILLSAAAVQSFGQPAIPRNAAQDTGGVMSQAYWDIWNPDVQAKIDADIEQNRKADAYFQIPGLKKGTDVKVEQISSDFYFGAHIFNYEQLGKKEYNDRYKDLYGTLFNSATIAFYWKPFEPVPGSPRFAEQEQDTEEWWNNCPDPNSQSHWRRPSSDKVVEFCKSKGIRLHGHTLIWGNETWQKPTWLVEEFLPENEKENWEYVQKEWDNLTDDRIAELLPGFVKNLDEQYEKRITRIAERYYGMIDSWDVVNESATDFLYGRLRAGQAFCKSTYKEMPGDYVYKAYRTAMKSFPEKVKLNINDWNLGTCYPYEVNWLRSRGCKIDIMGSQMHLFNPQQCLDIANGAKIQTPDEIYGWCSRLSMADLPIHLSEITITAPGNDERGQMIQAIITRNLYRLWFSLKPLMGITWWNVVDGCGAPGEPTVSGLFSRDMQPKPSYYALEELILHEWRTDETVKADRNGGVQFRGFRGNYRLTWTDKDGQHSKEFHLE